MIPYTTKFSLAKIFAKGSYYVAIGTKISPIARDTFQEAVVLACELLCAYVCTRKCVKIFTVQKNWWKKFSPTACMYRRNWWKFLLAKISTCMVHNNNNNNNNIATTLSTHLAFRVDDSDSYSIIITVITVDSSLYNVMLAFSKVVLSSCTTSTSWLSSSSSINPFHVLGYCGGGFSSQLLRIARQQSLGLLCSSARASNVE